MGSDSTFGSNKPPITPTMKVGVLLDAYPDLEDVLLELAPAFEKLKNPVLRKTVAKVATLRQAAQVGGIDIAAMVNALRRAAGQSEVALESSGGTSTARPDWCRKELVAVHLDVGPILARGEQPMAAVMEELTKLPAGKMLKLRAPLLPAPLIDMARSRGFESWSESTGPDQFVVYFLKK